jgi:excisionase family DNA binding protein
MTEGGVYDLLKALTLNEVAKLATITRRHLESLIAKGEGPVVIPLGRRKAVLEEDFDAWLRSRRQVTGHQSKASAHIASTAAEENCDAAPAGE